MYDKVKIWIPLNKDTPDITQYLDMANEKTNIKTGELVCISGCKDGLKINAFPNGISIIGSLSKYLYPNNIYTLDRKDTKHAFEKMADALHLNVSNSHVTGIEFGTQLILSKHVNEYLTRLGEMPRMKRCNITNTLYYMPKGKQQSKIYAFYDKIADAKYKNMTIPKGLEDTNMLKYEIRLSGHLSKQLKAPKITASKLSDPHIYRTLKNHWKEAYFSISRYNVMRTNAIGEIKSPKDAYDIFVARLISQTGPKQVKDFLDELKGAKVFANRNYYTRLMQMINDVSNKETFTTCDEFLKELDNEIVNTWANQ